MANFVKVFGSGLALRARLPSTGMNQLDTNVSKAINGDDGSHHAPGGMQIWIEGLGFRVDGPMDGHWYPASPILVDTNGFWLTAGAGLKVGNGVIGSLLSIEAYSAFQAKADSISVFQGTTWFYGTDHIIQASSALHFNPTSWIELFDADIELHRVVGTPKLRLFSGARIQLDSGAFINFSDGALIKGTAKVDTDCDLEIASNGTTGLARLTGVFRLDDGSIVRVQGGATLRSLWDVEGEPEGDVTIDGAWLFKNTGGANNFLTFKTGTHLTVGSGATFSMQGSATISGPTTRTGGVLLSGDGAFTRMRVLVLADADISKDGLSPTIVDGTAYDRIIIDSALSGDGYVKLASAVGFDGCEVKVVRRWPSGAAHLHITSADSALAITLTGAPGLYGTAAVEISHDQGKWRAGIASPAIYDIGSAGVLIQNAVV